MPLPLIPGAYPDILSQIMPGTDNSGGFNDRAVLFLPD